MNEEKMREIISREQKNVISCLEIIGDYNQRLHDIENIIIENNLDKGFEDTIEILKRDRDNATKSMHNSIEIIKAFYKILDN